MVDPCSKYMLVDGNADAWKKNALGTINAVLKEPLKLRVRNVVGGGDQAWAVLELEANGVCKNGMEYPQRYSWWLHFDDKGVVYEVRSNRLQYGSTSAFHVRGMLTAIFRRLVHILIRRSYRKPSIATLEELPSISGGGGRACCTDLRGSSRNLTKLLFS